MTFKHMLPIFLLISLLTAIVAGCGNEEQRKEDKDQKSSGIVPVYTPGSGGISYILSAGIGKIFNSQKAMPDVQLVTEATSGGSELVQMILDKSDQGKPAIGINALVDVAQAYDGNYDKMPGEHKNLRAVNFMNYAAAHMLVSEKSGIRTYEDLKGKKIGLPPGSATETIIKAVLKDGYGLADGDYKVIPLEYKEIQEGIQDGSIDAGPLLGAIPAPLVNELAQLHEIHYLSIDADAEKRFLEENPYYTVKTVDANTYPGQKEEIKIASMDVIAFTHKDTDDELVYQFIDTILSNKEELDKVHPAAKGINENTILNGMEIPLHPGAEKYYKEKGIEKK